MNGVRKKSMGALAIILVICIVSAWQIHRVYYFNPLTFRQNAVTPALWTYYKNPMELDVWYQNFYGTSYRYTTKNRMEINYVLSELRNAHPETAYTPSWDVGQRGQIWVQFHNPVSGNDYVNAIIRDNFRVDLLNGVNHPFEVTSGLKEFIEQKKSNANLD